MHSSKPKAPSSAGQRTNDSPDYGPPESLGQSLVITLRLPPGLLPLFCQAGEDESSENNETEVDAPHNDDDEGSVEKLLDDSSEDNLRRHAPSQCDKRGLW